MNAEVLVTEHRFRAEEDVNLDFLSPSSDLFTGAEGADDDGDFAEMFEIDHVRYSLLGSGRAFTIELAVGESVVAAGNFDAVVSHGLGVLPDQALIAPSLAVATRTTPRLVRVAVAGDESLLRLIGHLVAHSNSLSEWLPMSSVSLLASQDVESSWGIDRKVVDPLREDAARLHFGVFLTG